MAVSKTFAAVDLGATSGRVILGRLDAGHLSLHEIHRFPNEPVTYNGGLHWDLPRLWLEVCRGLDSAGGPESIGVDAWGVDYALLGDNGELLGNPYHYRDRRTDGMLDRVHALVDPAAIYGITGIQFMPINTLYQLFAARLQTPGILSAAKSFLTIPDLINFWLTGVAACEYTAASTTQMLDHRSGDWSTNLLDRLGIPTHFLRPLIQPGTLLGRYRDTAVVAPACHDTGSAFAAVCSGDDTAFLSSGTWSLLGAEVAHPIVTPAAQQLNFTNEGGVCGSIRLLKNITGLWLLESCRRIWDRGPDACSLEDLLAAASLSAPFAHMLDPDHPAFLHPPDMTVAIADHCRHSGQSVPASPGAFVRAIFEGLARKYRVVLEQLETVSGRSYRRIRVVGGGSRIALLNQLIADECGRTVVAGPAEATALGNIAMQMLATGAVSSLAEAREMIDRSFPPVTYLPH